MRRETQGVKALCHGREPSRGFVLLASLVAVMLLAALAGWVQMRSVANQRLAAALAADLRDGLARDALYDRLRGMLADQMVASPPRADRPQLNGTSFAMQQGGLEWRVEVQDQQGLLDLYLSDPSILALALPEADRVFAAREAALASLPPGARYAPLAMTLARFGLDPQQARLFTQSSRVSRIRLDTAPPDLQRRLSGLAEHLREGGQVTDVRVSLQRR